MPVPAIAVPAKNSAVVFVVLQHNHLDNTNSDSSANDFALAHAGRSSGVVEDKHWCSLGNNKGVAVAVGYGAHNTDCKHSKIGQLGHWLELEMRYKLETKLNLVDVVGLE